MCLQLVVAYFRFVHLRKTENAALFGGLDDIGAHALAVDTRDLGEAGQHRLQLRDAQFARLFRDQVDPPGQRMARAFDSSAAGAVQPVGRFGQDRFQPQPQPDQRPAQFRQRRLCCPGPFDERPVKLRGLGLQSIARFLPAAFIAGVDAGAYGGEQLLDRAAGHALSQSLEPAVAGQRLGRMARGSDRLAPGLVIAGNVGQPRRQAAAAALAAALWPDHPAAQLDCFRAG